MDKGDVVWIIFLYLLSFTPFLSMKQLNDEITIKLILKCPDYGCYFLSYTQKSTEGRMVTDQHQTSNKDYCKEERFRI